MSDPQFHVEQQAHGIVAHMVGGEIIAALAHDEPPLACENPLAGDREHPHRAAVDIYLDAIDGGTPRRGRGGCPPRPSAWR